jgi:hypothetical protein
LRSRAICTLVLSFVVFLMFQSLSYAKNLFIWPASGSVITEFGYTPYQRDGHRGIDIEAGAGKAVRAAAAGRVYWTGAGSEGPGVGIEHENGIRTTYMPVDKSVRAGQAVNQGDIIGTVQENGATASSHLHFVIKKPPYGEKDYLDPRELLSSAEQNSKQISNPDLSPTKLISPSGNSDAAKTESVNPAPILNPASTYVLSDESRSMQRATIPDNQADPGPAVSTGPVVDAKGAIEPQEVTATQNANAGANVISGRDWTLKPGEGESSVLSSGLSAPRTLPEGAEPAASSSENARKGSLTEKDGARPAVSPDPNASASLWSTSLLAIAGSLVLVFAVKKKIGSSGLPFWPGLAPARASF